MGAEGEAARRHPSHGGRFSQEARDPEEGMNAAQALEMIYIYMADSCFFHIFMEKYFDELCC